MIFQGVEKGNDNKHWDYIPVSQLNKNMVIQLDNGSETLIVKSVKWNVEPETRQPFLALTYTNTQIVDIFYPGQFVKVFGLNIN